jgi:hypothetical protein
LFFAHQIAISRIQLCVTKSGGVPFTEGYS